MDEWHFSRDGGAHGPLRFDELIAEAAQGRLTPADLVWTQAFTEWRPAGTIPALFPDGQTPPQRALIAAPEDRFGGPAGEQRRPADDVGPSDTQRGSFIGRHWRGELSLAASYWLCGVLGSVVLGLAIHFAVGLIEPALSRNYLSSAGILATFIVVSAALSIWQLVGIWRSASRSTRVRGARFWPIIAKILVMAAWIGAPVRLLPLAANAYHLASIGLGLSDFGTPQVALEGSTLTIRGDIGPGSAELVSAAIRGRTVETVQLESRGGLIEEARSIAVAIHARTADTAVRRMCYSACTVILLAGRRRSMSPDAQIGFHRPWLPGANDQLAAEALAAFRRVYLEAGLSPAFVDRIMATPNSEMLTLPPSELIALGVVHSVGVDRAEFLANLRAQPVFAALERADRRRFDAFVEELATSLRNGASVDALLQQALASYTRLSGYYIARADDDVVLDTLALAVERDTWLMERDPETCAAYQRPDSGARVRVGLQEKGDLLQRLSAMTVRIIESGARADRAPPSQQTAQATLLLLAEAVSRTHGANLDVLDRKRLTPADFPVLCRTGLAFYAAIQALPRQRQATIYRYLSSAVTQ